MKKLHFILIFILLFSILSGCGQAENPISENKHTINYLSTDGGYVSGKTVQDITNDSYTEMVMAVPYEGYLFVGWDDGRQHPTRADKSDSNVTVTAIFKKKEYKALYSANVGGKIIGESSQTIKYGEDSQIVKAVPMEGYEFIGWSDGVQTAERTDATIKRDIEVRANFASKDTTRFPILLVFVTEVYADLELKDDSIFKAEYVMTPSEKKICDLIQYKLSGFLNDIFAGEVVFEFDTYYTQKPLSRDNLICGTDAWLNYAYSLDTESITEIEDKLNKYRSIITTISFRDYEHVALANSGAAMRKYAEIYSDWIWGPLDHQNLTPEFLLNFNEESVNGWWDSIIDTYIHEFTHAAELYYAYSDTIPLDLHGFISYYIQQNEGNYDMESIKLYLLGKACVDGEMIGIPKSFWISEPNI